MVKKTLSIFLSMLMVLSLVSCSTTSIKTFTPNIVLKANTPNEDDINIWSVQTTEKILADHYYDDNFMSNSSMEIWAYQNDYEAGQIIITPKNNVNSYDVELRDLTMEDGTTLSKNDFTVYNQKYYEIDQSTRNTTTELGWYPDAILPFEVAKEYGENTIKAGNNQGLWFTLKTSATQKAGTYTGNFKITCDGKNYEVPVSVTVWDVAISEETHTRVISGLQPYWTLESSFWATMANGEKDFSDAMVNKYYDVMLDHRISSFTNTSDIFNSEEYAAELFEKSLDSRCTTVVIAGINTWEWLEDAKKMDTGINWDRYKEIMYALANNCINYYKDTGIKVNAFDKCITYFLQTDEALLHGHQYRPNFIFSHVKDVCAEISQEWLNGALECDDNDFINELTQSMCDIEQVYVDRFYEDSKVRDTVTWCPTIERYNTAYERGLYEADNPDERWWYTCNNPLTPYPTFHTDDPQQMLSSRIMGWMQFDYNVIGNLYWSATYYVKSIGGNANKLEELEDFYAGGRRETGANGDGYLFFPGAPYGIDGPISTIRLESWRDGLEDYEVMYAYEQDAKKVDENANVRNILSYLYETLYNGTKVSTTSDKFLQARKSLAQLAVAANKGVVISDVQLVNGKPEFTVYAPSNVQLKMGESILEGVVVGNNKRYVVKTKLVENDNVLEFTADNLSVSVNFGGDVVEKDANYVLGNNVQLTRAKGELVDATVDMGVDGKVYKLTANGEKPFAIMSSDFFTSLDNNYMWAKLYIYSEEIVNVKLWTLFENGKAYTEYLNVKLSKGMNEIVIQTSTMNFNTLGHLKNVRLDIDPNSTIYVVKGVVKK